MKRALLGIVVAFVTLSGCDLVPDLVGASDYVNPLENSASTAAGQAKLDTTSWTASNLSDVAIVPAAGSFEATGSGLVVHGVGYRAGAVLFYNKGLSLRGRTINYKFMANGGGTSMGVSCVFSPSATWAVNTGGHFMTTAIAYKSYPVVPENTWLYGTWAVDGSGNYTGKISSGNYASSGGTVLDTVTSLTALANVPQYLAFALNDNYAGTEATLTIGECTVY